MSFRIGKHTTLLANGFRPALHKQLARAIKDLDISSRAARPARIHSARKRMKKVRAALRLLGAASFPSVSGTEHNLLRDASAEVAPTRSADANMQSLKKLCSHTDSDHLRFTFAFAALEKQEQAAAHKAAASMHKAATLLKAVLARVDSWDDGTIPWKDVRRGVKHLYKEARAAFKKARGNPTAENLHHWRKRAKDIWHCLKLIEAVNPAAIRPIAQGIKKLGSLLGNDHDLALLRDALHDHEIEKEKTALEKLISARRGKLQRKALKLGAKYFSRKPGDFIKKIDG